MISTKNFNPATDKKLLCTCGDSRCDKRSVSQAVLDMLQKVRDDANRSVVVTSGGRCPYHPDERKRVTPADHQKCIAIDIAVNGGIERAQIVVLGLKYGFNAIGVAKGFIHLGYRKDEPTMFWTY